MNEDLFESFLFKTVKVKIEGFTVIGKLCAYCYLPKMKFCVLYVHTKDGIAILRGNPTLGEV